MFHPEGGLGLGFSILVNKIKHMPIPTRQVVVDNILDLSEEGLSRLDAAIFESIAAQGLNHGWLVFGSKYWVPWPVKSVAMEALTSKFIENGMTSGEARHEATMMFAEVMPVTLDQLAETISYAPMGNLSFSYFRQTFGIKPELASSRGAWEGKGFSQPASRKPKFATLICFEGVDAERCANLYSTYVEESVSDMMDSPIEFIRARGFKSTVCCVQLHDCQKHPLKG